VVEQKEHAIDAGIAKAMKVLTTTLGSSAEAIADAVLGELAPPRGYDDDVAIVVYRSPPPPLQIEVPANPARLSDVRGQLSVRVEAQLRVGEIVLKIVDFGTWKPPSGDNPFRGRGIPLMRAVSDRVQLNHTSSRTTVEMVFRMPDQRAAENARSDST
jgi:hypothetical protein